MGTLFLIKTILKNKKILKDYSLLGSLLTFIAMIIVTTAQGLMGFALSVVLHLPTIAYWGLATFFSCFNRRKKKKHLSFDEAGWKMVDD